MRKRAKWKKILKNLSDKEKIILSVVAVILVLVIIGGVILALKGRDQEEDKPNGPELESGIEENTGDEVLDNSDLENNNMEEIEITDEDPQDIIVQAKPEGDGAKVDVTEIVGENETKELTLGIDVSKYQGTIDWKKVADSGIDFAMIRVGYRTMVSGEIIADSNAKYNMQEAQKYGIKVGVYFFSTALNSTEAEQEASWVADYISKYKITYPVAYDCEGFESVGSRHHNLTASERTDIALAFLKKVKSRGYEGMFYGAKGALESSTVWETSRIASSYKIWVAQYPSIPYPETPKSSYSGAHAMWQYTNQGTISGINKKVDVNVAYFGYDKEQEAQDEEKPEDVDADVEALMNFTDVNEKVTAKEKVNLRDKPSQGSDSKVIYALKNGEEALRTGTSNSGWSRVEYKGKTFYAVSSYLTTDLSYRPPQEEPDDGINTEFKKVNEKVTAKDVVNLRQKPSVDDSVGPVAAQLKNGEVAVRTGINYEVGWSRVEYNGQVLYCISSYLMEAE